MIVVVMGVAGSGKSTVGTMLADAMHCPFLDGDSLHSAAKVSGTFVVRWLSSPRTIIASAIIKVSATS